MNTAGESLRIAYRVSDKQFVVRDAQENDVFAGTYREVESWLDHRENRVSALRETEEQVNSETDTTNAILKATMLTQEMVDKALAPDTPPAEHKPKAKSLRGRWFGRKQKSK